MRAYLGSEGQFSLHARIRLCHAHTRPLAYEHHLSHSHRCDPMRLRRREARRTRTLSPTHVHAHVQRGRRGQHKPAEALMMPATETETPTDQISQLSGLMMRLNSSTDHLRIQPRRRCVRATTIQSRAASNRHPASGIRHGHGVRV